jgi:putative endonuclease
MSWIYILQLSNGNYYIGSTRNLKQRLFDHQHGKSGYTSKYLPIELKYSCEFRDYSEALKIEKYLKKLKNKKAIELIIKSQSINIYQ